MALNLTSMVQGLLSWLDLLLILAAIVVCVLYIRVSSWMILLVAAFAGMAASVAFSQLLVWMIAGGSMPAESVGTLFLLSRFVGVSSMAALVVGLAFVFRDVRERFHFIRESYAAGLERERQLSQAVPPREAPREIPPAPG